MTMYTDTNNRLTALPHFGTDPGSLSADIYIPKNFPKNGPLVVVLHGSTQSAADYDLGSGWSTLAEECGIALLFPGQRLTNNMIGSFNWFKTGDSQRGEGEPLSIRQMIKQVVDDHAIDPSRVFITRMSSGGAMTSVMLATYPEVFAGGAIIAGLALVLMETLADYGAVQFLSVQTLLALSCTHSFRPSKANLWTVSTSSRIGQRVKRPKLAKNTSRFWEWTYEQNYFRAHHQGRDCGGHAAVGPER